MSVIPAAANRWPRLHFASGTLEALKWFAVAAMVLDHVNLALFGYELGPWAAMLGRMAFPVFAVVFGFNLARPGADHAGIALRLTGWAVLATAVYGPLLGWWPLNILWTLAAAAFALAIPRRGFWPWVLVAGLFVDYLWPGLALVLAARSYARRPSMEAAGVFLAGLLGVGVIVGNQWAFLALPLLAVATRWDVAVPRGRRLFLWVYVGHLGALLAIREAFGV